MSDISTNVIVDGTLSVLIGASVITWALILIKGVQHLRISYNNRKFSKEFWSAASIQAASQIAEQNGPAARVAGIGYSTLIEAEDSANTNDLAHTWDRQELLDRRLRQQMQKERGSLESGLAILATIGNVSPFVGLFGTVWGIMGALTNISKSGSASLEVVAGPIGEALVATAIGIAVAVPAVVAYNFFLRRNKVVWAFLDDFAIDFIHLALKSPFITDRSKNKSASAQSASRLTEINTGKKAATKDNFDELHAKEAHA